MIDICRTTDAIILDQEVDLIIQQLDILFDTNPGEVLGAPGYGADYDRFIWELNIGPKTIANYIYNNILDNVEMFDWTLDVNVELMVGEQNDIILVEIEFSKDTEHYTHLYKISNVQETAPIS